MHELTYKGWFYIVPVWLSEDGEYITTRWTEWEWPIDLMCGIHNFLNFVFQRDAGFPIFVTGVK